MKFSSRKKDFIFFAMLSLFIATPVAIKPNAEDKRIECGRKVGATLAFCLFKTDDNRSFLDYMKQWRSIIEEYRPYFDESTVATAIKALDDIENYVKAQYAQGQWVNATKVATFLSQLTKSLPADVAKQLDATFEQLQLKLLKRNKPLGALQLLAPLSNRLNPKSGGASAA